MKALLVKVPGGATVVLLATAIAGGAGYLVNASAPLALSPEGYAEFSVLWSVLYLLIALLAGVQQEVARSASPAPPDVAGDASAARRLAAVWACGAAVVVLVAGVPLVAAAVGRSAAAAVPAVAVAVAGYAVVAVLSGLLAGVERWRWLALLMVLDGLIRLVVVLVLLLAGADVSVLMWGVAAPFVLVPLLVAPGLRRVLSGRVRLDVPLGPLGWNSARAVLAAAAGGLMISGFPLLLAVTSPEASKEAIAGVNLAINLVRAPLVVVVLALQSYLVVRFRAAGAHSGPLLVRLLTGLAGVTCLAALAAAVIGPLVLRQFGPAYDLPGWFLGVLVAGSGALGALCVTGALVLARADHGRFLGGWAVAAAVTVLALLLPLDLQQRVAAALVIGPAAGLLGHLWGAAARG